MSFFYVFCSFCFTSFVLRHTEKKLNCLLSLKANFAFTRYEILNALILLQMVQSKRNSCYAAWNIFKSIKVGVVVSLIAFVLFAF